ncbi:MAG: hypothetical protein FWG36_11025 [Oscillospiraceae bacterium]|nr:hypothetical protein [Oscillospiraceae bacterium]
MEKELLEKCQILVDAGMGHLVKHIYVQAIIESLTADQLKNVAGGLSDYINDAIRSTIPVHKAVSYLIDMAEKGYLKHKV